MEKNEKNILIQTIDEIYPEFKSSIYGLVPKLSTDELYMCYLIKTNLRPIDIAHQMCKERSSISMKQTRLSKKCLERMEQLKCSMNLSTIFDLAMKTKVKKIILHKKHYNRENYKAHIIYISLVGRIGNIMFQLAAAGSLAKK
ncbi:MAG: hypothetical protein LUG51_10840 [Tannerellaceae bacterium]|nr:hypothetical protein [Tannerellaceae bacterium]